MGYSFPQTDDEEGAHNIFFFLDAILRHNYLDNKWAVARSSLTQEMTAQLTDDKFSFSVSDSNPYNAIVEACNVLGYKFYVDYNRHLIRVYIPDKNKFSGYRYRPETNLKSFSASYDMSELCTLMHAVGGTDANDQNIPLVPALPYAFKRYFCTESSWQNEDFMDGGTHYRDILDYIINCEKGVCKITGDVVEEAAKLEDGNYKYFIGSVSDDEKKRVQQLQTELDECITFAAIADKVPYLGQFLCDFSYFDVDHNGLLTDVNKAGIYKILNQMRVYNTWLKIYTPNYYNAVYTLVKRNAELETLAEQYEAEYRVIEDKQITDFTDPTVALNLQTIQEIQDKMLKLVSDTYLHMFDIAYGNNVQYYKIAEPDTAKYPLSYG